MEEVQPADCVPETSPQDPQLQVSGYLTQTPSAPSEEVDRPREYPKMTGQPVTPVSSKVLDDTVRYPAANLRLLGQEALRILPV